MHIAVLTIFSLPPQFIRDHRVRALAFVPCQNKILVFLFFYFTRCISAIYLLCLHNNIFFVCTFNALYCETKSRLRITSIEKSGIGSTGDPRITDLSQSVASMFLLRKRVALKLSKGRFCPKVHTGHQNHPLLLLESMTPCDRSDGVG